MRIVHALSEVRFAHGGVVRAVLDLSAALARRGHHVTLLTFDDTDVPAAWRSAGPGLPTVVPLSWPRFPKPVRQFRPADVRTARRAIGSADVLHLHVPWEATNLQLARAARRVGVPYVLSVHGMLDDWTISRGLARKRAFLALGGRAMLDRAAAVHCTAHAEKDQAEVWYSNPRTIVLPLLMDLEPFASPAPAGADASVLVRVPGEGPIVLFFSRLHPKKGVEVLIDAAALLAQRGAAFRLVIAGAEDHMVPGYAASLRARVRERGIENRTAFVGLVGGEARRALLSSACVQVLPTSQENWGFSLLESLAAGTPVVTTRGVDIWRELESSGGAVIADQVAEAFAGAIEPLVRDPARARAMGGAGRAWVFKELDPAAVLSRYEQMYEGIAQRRG